MDDFELEACQYCGPSGPRRRVEVSAVCSFWLLDGRKKLSDAALQGVYRMPKGLPLYYKPGQKWTRDVKKYLPKGATNAFLDTPACVSGEFCGFSCIKITIVKGDY